MILRKKMGKYFSLERFENQVNNLYPKLSNFKRVVSSFNIKRYSISKHETYKKIKAKERKLKMIRNARLLEQKFVEMSKREIEIALPTSKYNRFLSNQHGSVVEENVKTAINAMSNIPIKSYYDLQMYGAWDPFKYNRKGELNYDVKKEK